MRDRIKLIMERVNLSQAHFADAIGAQRATVHHILSGRNNPSLDIVSKIHNAFPSVDLKWLITGQGNSDSIDALGTETSGIVNTNKTILKGLFDDENQLFSNYGMKDEKKTNYNGGNTGGKVAIETDNEGFADKKNVSVTKEDRKSTRLNSSHL